jgi:hypothetical protein
LSFIGIDTVIWVNWDCSFGFLDIEKIIFFGAFHIFLQGSLQGL